MKTGKKADIDREYQKKAFSAIILFFLTLGLFLLMLYANIPNIYRIILFIPFYRILLLMIESYYQIPSDTDFKQNKTTINFGNYQKMRIKRLAVLITGAVTIALVLF